MKKYQSICISLIIALFMLMSSNLNAQWQQDSKYGFKINIPSNWNKNSYMDGTDQVYDYMSADENIAVQLRAFKAGAEFTTELLAQVYEESMLPAGTQKLSLNNHTTTNGIPSKKGVYLIDYNGTEVGLSALYIVQNNNGYVLTALIPSSMIQQRGGELKRVIKSFTIDGFSTPAHTAKKKSSGLGGLTGSMASNSFKIAKINLSNKVDANNHAINPTTIFNPQTSEIFAVINYTGGTQKDLIVSWIFNDWNRTISSDTYNFTDNKGGIGVVSISKPNAGWPVGSYSVKFEMDRKIIRELGFTVSEQSSGGGSFNGSKSSASGSSSGNQGNHQLIIRSHEAYDFNMRKVISFAESTGEGFAVYGGCEGMPAVGGKFIVTSQNSFQNTTAWDKAKLSNVGRQDTKLVPLNKVCIYELRDGSYGKFMFVSEKQGNNSSGCVRTITFQVEYPASGNNNRVSNTNIAGKYNLTSRSDGKSLVDYHFIDLKSDGTYWEEYSPKDSGGYVSENAGTWKVVGNQLTLTQRYGGVSDSYTISGNKLIRTSSDGTTFTFRK